MPTRFTTWVLCCSEVKAPRVTPYEPPIASSARRRRVTCWRSTSLQPCTSSPPHVTFESPFLCLVDAALRYSEGIGVNADDEKALALFQVRVQTISFLWIFLLQSCSFNPVAFFSYRVCRVGSSSAQECERLQQRGSVPVVLHRKRHRVISWATQAAPPACPSQE